MRRPGAERRAQRRAVAVVVATVAIVAVVIEPFPEGFVLLGITDAHGIDAGDVPAILLLLVAAWLTVRGGV